MDTELNAPESAKLIYGRYDGDGPTLFKIALWTGFLTLITLGIYRFWARTRIRRYMWSATTPDGTPFEYTGTGLEKFLGFLIAVVVLAVYLGIIQMVLMFFGLSLFGEPETLAEVIAQVTATYITFLAVVPLIFIAQYRGRRYLLSRTRWRGIRFGVEKGAVGYMLRAVAYYLLAILTLGILLPLATFKLEEYRVNRTWFGDAKMHQGGRWQMLYPAMMNIFFAFALLVIGVACQSMNAIAFFFFFGMLGYIWAFVGFVSYQVKSFAILAAHKRLGEDITFVAEPQTGTVIYHWIVGGIGVGIFTLIFFFIPFLIIASLFGLNGELTLDPRSIQSFGVSGPMLIVPILLYIFFLIVLDALTLVFIRQPIQKHYTNTFTLKNAEALAGIRQRGDDSLADADGFADALDVGAGI